MSQVFIHPRFDHWAVPWIRAGVIVMLAVVILKHGKENYNFYKKIKIKYYK